MEKTIAIKTDNYAITISQAADRLENICRTYLEKDSGGNYAIPVNRQRPVMLIGPAGIGKTDIPKQTAEKLDIGYVSYSITHHTRQSALGLPKIVTRTYNGNEVATTEYTASEIVTSVRDEIERSGKANGILFIDEVNCASETLAAPMLQLFQNKTLGQSKIPDGWILVMAGNPPEYNKSVKEFDAVTRDRLRIINVIPDGAAWLDYAAKRGLNPIVTAFITSDPTKIYAFGEDNIGIVSPRGWEELCITIDAYERNNFPVTADLVAQFIGIPTVADEFYNYYILVKETITEEEIELIVRGKASKELIKKVSNISVNIRFMLIECMKRKLRKCAVSGDMNAVNEMMNNIASFVKTVYGSNGEMEMFMSSILTDSDIVKAAIITHNEHFGKYLDDVTTAESSIKKKLRKTAARKSS